MTYKNMYLKQHKLLSMIIVHKPYHFFHLIKLDNFDKHTTDF